MKTIQVVSLIDLNDEQAAIVGSAATGIEFRRTALRRGEDPTPQVRDAEVLLGFNTRLDLSQAPNLAWVQLSYAGVDGLLKSPLASSSVQVTTASGIHAVLIAEQVEPLLNLVDWHRGY